MEAADSVITKEFIAVKLDGHNGVGKALAQPTYQRSSNQNFLVKTDNFFDSRKGWESDLDAMASKRVVRPVRSSDNRPGQYLAGQLNRVIKMAWFPQGYGLIASCRAVRLLLHVFYPCSRLPTDGMVNRLNQRHVVGQVRPT